MIASKFYVIVPSTQLALLAMMTQHVDGALDMEIALPFPLVVVLLGIAM